MTNLILLIVVGLIVGFIGGYAGIGGAPFLVVFLSGFIGMTQHTAQGTVLAVMLGPMSLLGILTMKARVRQNLKFAVIGVLSYAVFSYFGAYCAFLVDGAKLKIIFSIFVILIGLNEIFGILKHYFDAHDALKTKISTRKVALVGIVVGAVGGFFGVGAGLLMAPVFIGIFGMDKDDARLLSLMILLPPVSLGAVVKYQLEGAIEWFAVLIIFASYFFTNYFGSKLALTHSVKKFRAVYGYILILIGLLNLVTSYT